MDNSTQSIELKNNILFKKGKFNNVNSIFENILLTSLLRINNTYKHKIK